MHAILALLLLLVPCLTLVGIVWLGYAVYIMIKVVVIWIKKEL
jgi:hypothetical protein